MDNWKEILESSDGTPILISERFKPYKKQLSDYKSMLWFETSGSSGDPKIIGISKSGFLIAAESVNSTLGIKNSDKWHIAIPTYHVGGASIIARSFVGGFSTFQFEGKWNSEACLKEIEKNEITIISLVPTQLFDLVKTKKPAPKSLRRIVLGGGESSTEVISNAKELGYQIIETYGMTETSALAAIKEGGSFTLLSHLSVKQSPNGELEFKGESIVQKVGRVVNDKIEISDPRVDGWYTSSDLGEVLDERHFRFFGRKNRVVKILGELVSLDRIEREIQELFSEENIAVVDIPDERRGRELILFVESGEQNKTIEEVNQKLGSLERIGKVRYIKKFPLLNSGKVDFVTLGLTFR